MFLLLAALFVAFFSSIFTIKILLPLAPHIGLIDVPNERKKHDGAVPLIGGISIFELFFKVSLLRLWSLVQVFILVSLVIYS